jgi:murein DD-endopeptidase MepM/ murein hydrolase activator NlpD
MHRFIILFFHKISWWQDVKVRLPRVCDMVHTSVLYMAVAALLLVLSFAMLTYHVWREYRGDQWKASKALSLEDQRITQAGRNEKPSASATSGQQEKYLPQEKAKTGVVPAKDGADKPDSSALSEIRKEKMIKPLAGKILTAYGWQEDPVYKDWRFFPGVIIHGEKGSEIYAAKSGKVLNISRNARGLTVKIGHADGMVTIYGHILDSPLRIGQSLAQGQALGRLGSDGEVTLRFEIWRDNCSSDPGGLFEE